MSGEQFSELSVFVGVDVAIASSVAKELLETHDLVFESFDILLFALTMGSTNRSEGWSDR